MSVSVLIPWSDYPSGPERRRSFLWNLVRIDSRLPDAQIVLAAPDRLDSPGNFDRAVALNRAARKAEGDVFLICDADTTYADLPDFDAALAIASDGGWTLPARYVRLGPRISEAWLTLAPEADAPPWEHDVEQEYPFANSGVVVMPRAAYDAMSGFDERFRGWGGEDDAMRGALEALWGPPTRVGVALHLWHPRSAEETTSQPHNAANRVLADRYGAAAKVGRAAMLALIRERPLDVLG